MARGDVSTVTGRLPREAGTRQTMCPGEFPGGGESAEPVLQHGPGTCGSDGRQHRKHEHVSVPKDMPSVRGSREAPGSDRCFATPGRSSEQVEYGESRVQLVLGDVVVVSFDHHHRVLPRLGPGASVLGQEGVEAERSSLFEVLSGQLAAIQPNGSSGPCREPLDDLATIDDRDPLLRRHRDPGTAIAGLGQVGAQGFLSFELSDAWRRLQWIARREMTCPRLGSEGHGVRGGGGDETYRSQGGPRGTTASERAGAQVEQAMLIVAVVDGG